MSKTPTTTSNTPRLPVVVIMGHIDHGKSTLLDFIRKSNIVEGEVGGITQKMSAYEVLHKDKKITFLDTPGHESFGAIRARGASAADIAILIVSSEDGVKPQTVDAFKAIKKANLPYIVGISKIDKPNANIERTKISLSENEIYVEGYGGDISFVPFSGKSGEGIDDLLDMILLTAEVADFTTDASAPAKAIVIESNRDKNRGISATLIIKDGTLETGAFVVSGPAFSPVRIMENYLNKPIKFAVAGSPVRIIGWSELPQVGGECFMFKNKKEAEAYIEKEKSNETKIKANTSPEYSDQEIAVVPILIKADTSGSLEALKYEIGKLQIDRVKLKIVGAGLGDIQENDIKMAAGKIGTLIIGFSVKTEGAAKTIAEKLSLEIHTFDIIYKMTEWLEELAKTKTPRMEIEEQKGAMKVLKIFSVTKDKYVLGCRCESGVINTDDQFKLMRRGSEISRGRIRELQQQKNKVGEVTAGECGLMAECKMEIAPGDYLEAVHKVIK